MVAGDLVNTASRLQSVAPPGTVLVGEATYHAASDAIAFEPAGEQLLKGKAAPVPAYRALRVVARRGGAGRNEQLEAPFVGRGPELRMLKDFHLATGAERRPRLVSIIGQGGIGKSRLVWEFQKYIDGVTEVVYWHQGRSPAYGEGISFWALAEMVRGRAGITESDDPAGRPGQAGHDARRMGHRRGGAPLDGAAPPAAARPRGRRRPTSGPIASRSSPPGASSSSASPSGASSSSSSRTCSGPTTACSTSSTTSSNGHATGRSTSSPSPARSSSTDGPIGAPGGGPSRRCCWSRSTPEQMRELLAGLVPGLPEPVVERVLERAEGIPLYAVETVRMLLSEGLVTFEGGVYRPTGDLSELSVPASLHALIASRLDGLDVGGSVAAPGGLGHRQDLQHRCARGGQRPAGGRDRRLASGRSSVARCSRSRSIRARPNRASTASSRASSARSPTGRSRKRDRRRMHIAAARYFESLDDEGIAGALAEHYLAAYQAQPDGPEGAAVAAQARVALRGAAERARSLGSFLQATRFLEQALEVTTDPREEAQLQAAAGDAGINAGLIEEPIRHMARSLELTRAETTDRPSVDVGDRRAMRSRSTCPGGSRKRRRCWSRPATSTAISLETPEYVRLAAELARSYLLLGRDVDALRTRRRHPADRRAPRPDHARPIELLVTRGAALVNVGRLRESIVTLVGAVAASTSYGLWSTGIRARVNLELRGGGRGPASSPIDIAREGVELLRHLGMRDWPYMLGNAAELAIRIGDWDWALSEVEEAAADRDRPAARMRRAEIRGLRGMDVSGRAAGHRRPRRGDDRAPGAGDRWTRCAPSVALARGDARRCARAHATVVPARHRARTPGAPRTAARAAAWLGDVEAATEVLGVVERQRGRVAEASRREAESVVAILEGRREDGIAGFIDAIRRWRDLGLRIRCGDVRARVS